MTERVGRRGFVALLLLLTLAACAPLSQRAGRPELGFSGPRLEQDAFISFDGMRLPVQHWAPASGEPWAVVIGLHGMNDYANAFHLPGEYWAGKGIATYAYDQRGFGRSPRRGIWGGRELMDQDLRVFTALVRARHPKAVITVAGVSMGGAVAIDAFASADPPVADRVVLLSPAVWGWSSQPVTYSMLLWLTAHSFRGWVVEPPEFITRNIAASDNLEELKRMGRDPNMIWGARPDALYGLVGLMERGWSGTNRIHVPTLYLYGARDQIIPPKPAAQAAGRLGAAGRTAYYAEGCHLLLVDLQNPKVWDDVAAFVRDPAAPLPSAAPPIPAKPPDKAAPCIPR
jgi:acylglycerol lipase